MSAGCLSIDNVASVRRSTVEAFFERLPGNEQVDSTRIAEEIAGKVPLADTVVIIPVAAHQEEQQIAPALEQYAHQKVDRPFSVVLGLNCPEAETANPATQRTIDEVERAKDRYPQLDIRSLFRQYVEPRMGRIRRDLWNGVMLSGLNNGQIDEDRSMVGLNQDIDVISLYPRTIANVQGEYARHANYHNKFWPIGGISMTHGKSPKHPNISRAVTWADFVVRKSGGTFEAGLILPAESYALLDGIDGEAITGELVNKVGRPRLIVRGAYAVTSPRRFLQFTHEHGLRVWKDEIFTPYDRCRETDDFPDVSRAESLKLIGDKLDQSALAIRRNVIVHTMGPLHGLSVRDPELFNDVMVDSSFTAKVLDEVARRARVTSVRTLKSVTEGDKRLTSYLNEKLEINTEKVAPQLREYLLSSKGKRGEPLDVEF